jgi:hypothetical protein
MNTPSPSLFLVVVWIGGISVIANHWGFWASMFWPWYLGKYLGQLVLVANP